MKTISLELQLSEPYLPDAPIGLIADSALVMPAHPIFVPDFAEEWTARLYIAFRISRLGKSIQARFAPRYYDAVALALRILPAGADVTAAASGIFDYALALGPWSLLHADADAPMTLQCKCLGEPIEVSIDQTNINEVIERLSNVATLKNGDIIMPRYLTLPPEAVTTDTRFEASLGDDCRISVKIK